MGEIAKRGQRPSCTPATCLTACINTIQLISRLLPHLSYEQAAGSDFQGTTETSSASDSPISTQAGATLLPDSVQELQQLAVGCVTSLQAAMGRLQQSPLLSKTGPKADAAQSAALLQHMKALCCDQKLQSTNGSDSSSTPAPLPQRLHQLCEALLSQLPSTKVCANPACLQVDKFSERELCVRHCSGCGTAYCSKDCSQAHWRMHKTLCRRLAAARQAGAAEPNSSASCQKAAPSTGGGGGKSSKKKGKKKGSSQGRK